MNQIQNIFINVQYLFTIQSFTYFHIRKKIFDLKICSAKSFLTDAVHKNVSPLFESSTTTESKPNMNEFSIA